MSFYPPQIETDGLQIDSSERCRQLRESKREINSRPEFLNFRDAHVAMAGKRYTVISPKERYL